jgi:hypothetical protein
LALTLLQLALLVDAAGSLKLRELSIALFLIARFPKFINNEKRYKLTSVLICLATLTCLTASTIISTSYATDLGQALSWLLFLPFLLTLFILSSTIKGDLERLVNAGVIFALIILCLSILVHSFSDVGKVLIEGYFSQILAFKNQKEVYGVNLHVVYFQSTLALVPLGVLAFLHRRWISYFIILFALVVAPSRYGSILLLLFPLLFMANNRVKLLQNNPKYRALMILVSAALGFFIPIISGEDVRMLHLESISRIFDENPWMTIFGMGPGSEFYSLGFQNLTNDIELTHYETIRKYGVVLYIVILMAAVQQVIKRDRVDVTWILSSIYMTYTMNPGLLSLSSALLYFVVVSNNQEKINAK